METLLPCDGCGQLASPEHLTRRLQRLEWTSRFRPLHIQTLLVGAISPESDSAFLYNPAGNWTGEAAELLSAAGIQITGKTPEAVLSEFQKLGLQLIYVLECPLENNPSESQIQNLLQKHLGSCATRIRRSLKPKRVRLISPQLEPFALQLSETELGIPVSSGRFQGVQS
jgi:hypothetical protein